MTEEKKPENPNTSTTKKPSTSDARTEQERREAAEAKRAEQMRREAEERRAREAELEAERQRRESQTKQMPNSEVKKADGSVVKTGDNGRISEVADAQGNVTKFGYDAKGQLNSVTDKTGTWTTTDGLNWSNGTAKRVMRGDVYEDGSYAFTDGKKLTVHRTDGTAVEQNLQTQLMAVKDKDGRIVETHVGDGPSTHFKYGADGQLNKIATADGATWTRNQDGTFTSTDGTVYKNLSMREDGSLKYFAVKPPNRVELEKAVDAIYAETGGRLGTGEDEVNALLKDKTEAEKAVMDEIYQQKYHKSLEQEFRDEMEGSDLDKALELLHKKDDDANDAGRIHTALIELTEYTGRSDFNIEKDIRQTLSTRNSDEIAKLDAEYRAKYGVSLSEALANDPNLSEQSKAAIAIYLKGTDKRTDEDSQALFTNALKAMDVEMFNEAMSTASPESRKQFLDNGGKEKIEQAFFVNPTEMQHALDYAESGRLTTSSKVADNTSWSGDNEQAIEQSLKDMPPEERQAYMRGKMLAEGKQIDGLSTEDAEKARKTYETIHKALEGAGDPWEVAKWEDQIAVRGGTLVTQLAAHRGSIYDDGMGAVLTDIENMSEQDWKRYRSDEGYRKLVDTVLHDYLNDSEYARAKQALDAKMNSETYDGAKTSGRRDLTTTLADNEGTFNDDEHGIWDAVQNMTAEEQKRYRDDADFRNKVDNAVKSGLDEGAEQDAAWGMLARVRKGQDPKADIVDKLNMHAADVDTDEAQVVRDLQEAFAADPTLRERMLNPQTDEDRGLAQRFNIALHRALDPSEYERYAKPLLETGHLNSDVQMELNAGTFDDDEQGYYKDMVSLAKSKDQASIDEKARILNDQEYQDKVFVHLSAEERKISINALQQGEMRPEDLLYSYQVGAGTSEEEIKKVLAELTPEEKERVKEEYARKYGTDLTEDLFSELGGQDLRDANRVLMREPTNDREAFNRTRDEVNESRDGFGRAWVDNMWDGTGYMTDDAVLNYQKRLSSAHQKFQELSPEEQQELRETVQKNLDSFVQSKGAAADMVVDVVIIAAAVLGAKFTAGASLSAIAYTTLAGALFKIATKAAIMGADYDWASSQVIVDGLTGAIDTATLFLGPAQLGQALKLGEKGAATAMNKLLTSGAEQFVKTEMKQQLGKEIAKTVASAIAHGEEGVSDKAILALAKQFAVEGQEEVLAASIKQSLKEGMEQEARSALKRLVTETTMNAATGVTAGGSSGGLRGALEWDSSKSVQENLLMIAQQTGTGALTGGVLAGALTIGFKGVGFGLRKGYEGLQSLASKSEQSLKVNVQTEGGKAFVSSADNPHLEGIRKSDGTIVKFDGSKPIELQQGDLPIARLNEDGHLVDATGKRLNSNGTPMRDGTPVELGNYGEGGGGGGRSEVPPFKKQDAVTFGDEKYQVAGFDNRNGDVILYQEGRGVFDAHISPRVQEGELGTKYQPIRIDGKEYFRDAAGTVYAKIDAERPLLLPETQYRVVPRDQVKVYEAPTPKVEVVQTPKPEFNESPVQVRNSERQSYRYTKDNRLISVTDHVRHYEINGKTYELSTRNGSHGWFYGSGGESNNIKVHVTTKSADDLAKLQQVLIPALHDDPVLSKLAGDWKTFDPNWGTDPSQVAMQGHVPGGGSGQSFKGFTIYAKNAADAAAVQKRIDEILVQKGLALDSPHPTGNVDKISGASNRVGIVRDMYEPAYLQGNVQGAKIDEALASKIRSEADLPLKGNNSDAALQTKLRTYEQKLGLEEGVLCFDDNGDLMLKGTAGQSSIHENYYYLDESRAGKGTSPKDPFSDRPAMYRLFNHYGMDPAEAFIEAAQKAQRVGEVKPAINQFNGVELQPNRQYRVGRSSDADIVLPSSNTEASRNHLVLNTDAQGNLYISDAGSSNGTWVNGRRLQPGEQFRLRPGDKVEIGGVEIPWSDGKYYNKPSAEAVQQSNNFARNQEVSDKLEDGFHSGGQNRDVDAEGKALWGKQPITVVDKAELANLIQEAKERFGNLPEQEKAKALAHYVHDLLTPKGMNEKELNDWYLRFLDDHQAEKLSLGRFLKEGKGVCTQQALLLKALGDELGLDIKLVRGNGTNGGSEINHVWTEVNYGKGYRVFDPRMGVYDAALESMPNYRRGSSIVAERGAPPAHVKVGDSITYNDQKGWIVEGFDGKTGDVKLRHSGSRSVKPGPELRDFQQLNAETIERDAGLRVGQQYYMRRSTGEVEIWRLDAINADGSLKMTSDYAFSETVPREVIANRPGLEMQGSGTGSGTAMSQSKPAIRVVKKADAKPAQTAARIGDPGYPAHYENLASKSSIPLNFDAVTTNTRPAAQWLEQARGRVAFLEKAKAEGKVLSSAEEAEMQQADRILRSETDRFIKERLSGATSNFASEQRGIEIENYVGVSMQAIADGKNGKSFEQLLIESGIPKERARDWTIIRTGGESSGADGVGTDILLINKRTGEYFPIDVKTTGTKNMGPIESDLTTPGFDKQYFSVPQERRTWVVGAQEWPQGVYRNTSGAAQPQEIQLAEKQLLKVMSKMIEQGSPLSIYNAPLPSASSATTVVQLQNQVTELVKFRASLDRLYGEGNSWSQRVDATIRHRQTKIRGMAVKP